MKRLCIFICIIVFFLPLVSSAQTGVLDLGNQIRGKRKSIDDLQKQIEILQKSIRSKQKEAISLQNQLAIFEANIEKTKLEIREKKEQIETTNLEIREAELRIEDQSERIGQKKKQVRQFLAKIREYDMRNPLEIFFRYQSISDFFDQLRYLLNAQRRLQAALNELQTLKGQEEYAKRDLEGKRNQLHAFTKKLEEQEIRLAEQSQVRKALLAQTLSSEQKFQTSLVEARREQEQADQEIRAFEKQLREKLTGKKELEGLGKVSFLWPVDPSRGITSFFHDPDYPFRYIFEHPAIDIRAAQGTPIRATESGYVGRAKDNGLGYSWIMLIHRDGFATVYGHVSAINVKEGEYVVLGQVIGRTGGTPGTRGAGNLSTGPHLHLEVRLNGIPVNPLEYLP